MLPKVTPVFFTSEEDFKIHTSLSAKVPFIHIFVTEHAELARLFLQAKEHLLAQGQLWVSWPKGSSKIKTELNENIIREFGLEHGLVDVKIAAIDDDWSGLKFVYRLKDR